jgi:hypothetical protein
MVQFWRILARVKIAEIPFWKISKGTSPLGRGIKYTFIFQHHWILMGQSRCARCGANEEK